MTYLKLYMTIITHSLSTKNNMTRYLWLFHILKNLPRMSSLEKIMGLNSNLIILLLTQNIREKQMKLYWQQGLNSDTKNWNSDTRLNSDTRNRN